MEQEATTFSSISEETAIRQLEQARREVDEFIQDDSVDESVRQAAARRLKRAELQYQNVVFRQSQVSLQGHADEHTTHDSTATNVENTPSNASVFKLESSEHNPVLTNDPVELARIASDDVAFLEQHQDEVDKSVVEAALRKAEKATRNLSLIGDEKHTNFDISRKRSVSESDDEETNSGFEDSSLLEPFQTNGQRVTIDVIPINDDIDLDALGNAISEVEREEQWLKSRKIITATVGSKLVLRLNRAVSIKEVDWICDKLTDEFPDDIQSLEVKFHPANVS